MDSEEIVEQLYQRMQKKIDVLKQEIIGHPADYEEQPIECLNDICGCVDLFKHVAVFCQGKENRSLLQTVHTQSGVPTFKVMCQFCNKKKLKEKQNNDRNKQDGQPKEAKKPK